MEMPAPDAEVMARTARIVERLQSVLPNAAVIHDPAETQAYECDALTAYRCPPLCVVLPSSTREVSEIMRICSEEDAPVVPRGSGTSLAGGALPTADCVVLGVSRMTDILETDLCQPADPCPDRPHQPVGNRRGGSGRFLLRARPVEPAGLRHRREHRDEFRRRALPEIRGHDEQPAGRDDGADGRQRH